MLYLSSLLEERFPSISYQIIKYTSIKQIPNTNDIWIRDFMPIKNAANEWVLFRYFPKYLRNLKYQSLISNNRAICKALNLEYTYCDMILDGGSVVYQDDLYFVSERIFVDNPSFNKTQMIRKLEDTFKTDKIILLPEAPNDFTGHLDGVLSILDRKTILLNDYQDKYGSIVKRECKINCVNG